MAIFVAILLLLFAPSYSTCSGNALASGNFLTTSDSLSLGYCGLTMQADCNLVLYVVGRPVWESKTYGGGDRCQLTVTSNGQLLIVSGSGATVWASSFVGEIGNYELSIQQVGSFAVFNSNGNMVWSTFPTVSCR